MDVHPVSNESTFSWLKPHARFVMIFVGPDETPFAIQKDFLCHKSSFYRQYFDEQAQNSALESVVTLPEVTPQVFGLVQNFLYTGRLLTSADSLPNYELLIATWKLGHRLGIDGLCDEALEAMAECRRLTQSIPATPLLVQVWRDTPEGSSLRKLLLTWAAEYIRSSESRSEFSKSLPQEVLSELVVAMSHLDSAPVIQLNSVQSPNGNNQRKNVHYLDADDSDDEPKDKAAAKRRHSDVAPARPAQQERPQQERRPVPRKPARASLPTAKPVKQRKSLVSVGGDHQFTDDQKLNFCSDLLSRMLSGPGFWTRLVGPFRQAVNPVEDGVPDYLEKVTKPMDLGTIKDKMDRGQYKNDEDFVSDVRQIFTNCFTYWTDKDPMWATCEKFQKTFEEKYSGMQKWILKMDGAEEI
ncbi:hypothetical protein PG999_009616 [Apiospora kogelbergensis]|uniref:Uncharacterized protein n=1 Tax=Apiospora kogelbergensis TaxID=1337665 RepID=A0AAW0QJP5_9PEZI